MRHKSEWTGARLLMKAAAGKRLFQRPHESGFAGDCVIEPRTNRLRAQQPPRHLTVLRPGFETPG
jgi:hypothetical protein